MPANDPRPIRPRGPKRVKGPGPRLHNRWADLQSDLQREGSDAQLRLHHASHLQPDQNEIRPHVPTLQTGPYKYTEIAHTRMHYHFYLRVLIYRR